MKNADAIGDVVRQIRRGSYAEACGIVMGLLGIRDDLHAWALRHKATVEGMECGDYCASATCAICGCGEHSGNTCECENFVSRKGDCRKCRALREIEELL